VDFRCGADRLLVHVREVLAREPLDGSAYLFRNRRATRLKVLVVDAQGVWLSVRRLHQGRFVWPSAGETLWSLGRAGRLAVRGRGLAALERTDAA